MIPFVRDLDFAYGRPDRLSPLITRVIARNPGPYTFTGSGTYLIGDARGVAVIDPGPADTEHGQAVLAAAPGPVTDILVTHTHRDHCGGVAALRSATGATVRGFGPHPTAPDIAPPALDEGGDFSFRPETLMADGELLSLPSATLRAVHTPGHVSNHLCFSLEEEDALFTGDHVMGWATTVVAPPDGNMGDYMRSLDLLSARADRIYYPTHGAPIPDPLPFVDAIRDHRRARDAAIIDAVGGGAETPEAVVEGVYEGLDPALRVAAALNVRAHLDQHVAAGRVRMDGGRFFLT